MDNETLQVTREEAARLLGDAGRPLVWPENADLPLSGLELARQILNVCAENDLDITSWDAPLIRPERAKVDTDYGCGDAVEETVNVVAARLHCLFDREDLHVVGDLIARIEDAVQKQWPLLRRAATARHPVRAAFYALRRAFREMKDDPQARPRPSMLLEQIMPARDGRTVAIFWAKVEDPYGNHAVFPQRKSVNNPRRCWTIYCTVISFGLALILIDRLMGQWVFTLVGFMFCLMGFIVPIALRVPSWPTDTRTVGDLAQYVAQRIRDDYQQLLQFAGDN